MRTFVIYFFDRFGNLVKRRMAQVVSRSQAARIASMGLEGKIAYYRLEEV